MNKIRVMQILKGLDLGGSNGGAERFAVDLSFSLCQKGIEVIIFSFFRSYTTNESLWLDRLQEAGIKVIFFCDSSQSIRPIQFIIDYRSFARKFKGLLFDIVHSHYQIGSLLYFLLLWKKTSRHFIRTIHVTKEWGDGVLAWILRQFFSKFFFPLVCDAQIGVSQDIVDKIKLSFGLRINQKPVICIYNAINLDPFTKYSTEKLQVKVLKANIIIGSMSRLIPRKGYIYLLQAMPKLLSKYPGLTLIIAGEGEQKESLENLAKRLSIHNHVKFVGRITNVPEFFKSIDLFVLPSLVEGLPTVVLESMAAKVPVVATDISGTRELIEQDITGWLVSPGNPESLSKGIIHAISEINNWDSVCMNAYNLLSRFQIDNIAKQHIDLYQSISSGK